MQQGLTYSWEEGVGTRYRKVSLELRERSNDRPSLALLRECSRPELERLNGCYTQKITEQYPEPLGGFPLYAIHLGICKWGLKE